MHKSFAECAGADHHGAVEILECAGRDFCCRSGSAVGEHHERQVGSDGARGCLVDFLIGDAFASGAEHFGAFGQEIAEDADGAFEKTAAIAAKVEYESFYMMVVRQVEKRIFHLVGRFLGILRKLDVAEIVGNHAVIGYGRNLYFVAGHGDGEDRIGHPGTVDAHRYR